MFRIALTYNVPVDELIRLNRIEDPTRLRNGQLLFIPGASRSRYVGTASGKSRSANGSKKAATYSNKRSANTRSDNGGQARHPKIRLRWPVRGTITSGFGKLTDRIHDGIDIAAGKGTPVRAAAKGKVIYAGNGIRGYGNLVIIKHEHGFSTVYAHNDANQVQRGDVVAAGEVIATVGKTGRATGYHLHFEVRMGKKPVNPLQYLPR